MSFFTPTQAEKFLPKAYNSFASEFSSTRHYQWKEFDRLSKTVPKTGTIIDLGCGNARLYSFLQEKEFAGSYAGIDISKGLLNEAKKKHSGNKNLSFYEASFLDFPEKLQNSEENSSLQNVQQIWAVASFHHLSQISQRNKALQNIWNTLEVGGEFICTVWNLWDQKKYEPNKRQASWKSLYNPLWNKRDFIIPWGKQKTERYYYSFDVNEIEQLLKENGFEIIDSFLSEGKKNICIRAKKVTSNPVFYVENIRFDSTSISQTISQIDEWAANTNPKNGDIHSDTNIHTVFTPNPEMIMECKTNKPFKAALQNADISLADGNGILWASGLDSLQHKSIIWKWIFGIWSLFHFAFFRTSFPKKIEKPVCGSDLFQEYLETTVNENHIFLLGGAAESAKFISDKYPTKVTGYFDGMVNEEYNEKIIDTINTSKATVLFVALGAPKQELWIAENAEKLTNVRVALGVGGSFDFISGHQTRAPKILRQLRIEWMYRLWKQPQRWERIWIATGGFIGEILKNK